MKKILLLYLTLTLTGPLLCVGFIDYSLDQEKFTKSFLSPIKTTTTDPNTNQPIETSKEIPEGVKDIRIYLFNKFQKIVRHSKETKIQKIKLKISKEDRKQIDTMLSDKFISILMKPTNGMSNPEKPSEQIFMGPYNIMVYLNGIELYLADKLKDGGGELEKMLPELIKNTIVKNPTTTELFTLAQEGSLFYEIAKTLNTAGKEIKLISDLGKKIQPYLKLGTIPQLEKLLQQKSSSKILDEINAIQDKEKQKKYINKLFGTTPNHQEFIEYYYKVIKQENPDIDKAKIILIIAKNTPKITDDIYKQMDKRLKKAAPEPKILSAVEKFATALNTIAISS